MKKIVNFFSSNILYFVVFVTGSVVLIVEIIAVRILSPYFGNTLTSYSSILTTILLALSVGYYFGGKLADKKPNESIFYAIIGISGLLIVFINVLKTSILSVIGIYFSIITGPLVASLILFLFPATLLGMCSPFVITLLSKKESKEGIGTIAGKVFFFSTLGSIVGSLLAGFYLIPNYSVSTILSVAGTTLVVVGTMYFLLNKIRVITVTAIFATSIMLIDFTETNQLDSEILHAEEGFYERIVVQEGNFGGKESRILRLDKSMSSGVEKETGKLVFNYTKYYKLYEHTNTKVRNALILGGGVYTIPSKLKKDLPTANVEVVEIEPKLAKLAEEFFYIDNIADLEISNTDGRYYLNKSKTKYDYIYTDVYYSLISVPSHFTTLEFFETANQKMNKDGIFIGNFIGSLENKDNSFLLSEIKTFKKVFPNSYFFATVSPNSVDIQNVIFLALKNNNKIDFTDKTINGIYTPLNQFLISTDELNLESHIILTDNYAPVEYWMAKLLEENQERFN